jgi:hypothetical protein
MPKFLQQGSGKGRLNLPIEKKSGAAFEVQTEGFGWFYWFDWLKTFEAFESN